MTPAEKARAQIRAEIQRVHERTVWERLSNTLRGWRSGTFNDHEAKRLADLMDCELKSPSFLDPLIALLDELEPPKAP